MVPAQLFASILNVIFEYMFVACVEKRDGAHIVCILPPHVLAWTREFTFLPFFAQYLTDKLSKKSLKVGDDITIVFLFR